MTASAITLKPTEFTDRHGRKYDAYVSAQTAIDLQEQLGVNLTDLVDGDLLKRLASEPKLLVSVLWLTVEESAKAGGVKPEEFGRSLGGDALAAATDAMMEAITLFFRPSQRTVLRSILEKGEEVESLHLAKVRQTIDQLTPEQILTLSVNATSKPELQESVPVSSAG